MIMTLSAGALISYYACKVLPLSVKILALTTYIYS